MTNNQEIKDYYKNQKKRFTSDFLKPNIRIENAIFKTLIKIPRNVDIILDLGFGFGWSSYEFAKHFPEAKVVAYDISEELTETAKSMFQLPNLYYNSLDLTQDFPEGSFDTIVLLDVFEHIPVEARSRFYGKINDALTHKGKVILTCPSVYHQNYLRDHKPEGLQPVDEDVDLNIIQEFAHRTNTKVSHFEYLDIWNSRDYLFTVIEREYEYHKAPQKLGPKTVLLLDYYTKLRLLRKNNSDLFPELTLFQNVKYYFNEFFK